MRIWHIAMFIFVFNFMLNMGLGDELGFEGTVASSDEFLSEDEILEREEEISDTIARQEAGEVNWFYESVAMAWRGITIFGSTIVKTAVFTESFVETVTFGLLPDSFVLLMGLMVRLVLFVGMAQLLLGKSTKEME